MINFVNKIPLAYAGPGAGFHATGVLNDKI